MHHSQTDFMPEEKQPTERCSKGSHFLKSRSKLHHDTFPRPPPPPPGKANLLHRFLSQKSDLPWEKPDFECKNGCPQSRRVKPTPKAHAFSSPQLLHHYLDSLTLPLRGNLHAPGLGKAIVVHLCSCFPPLLWPPSFLCLPGALTLSFASFNILPTRLCGFSNFICFWSCCHWPSLVPLLRPNNSDP